MNKKWAIGIALIFVILGIFLIIVNWNRIFQSKTLIETVPAENQIKDTNNSPIQNDDNKETEANNEVNENKEFPSLKKEDDNQSSVGNKDENNVSKDDKINKPSDTANSSDSSNKDQNSTLPKTWTDIEIEEYAKLVISDFRLDFKNMNDCQVLGEKWSQYGWIYNCTHVEIPDSTIVAVMLNLRTGKIFCDNSFTESIKYQPNKKWNQETIVGNLYFLRQNGYPCTNIDGDIN